VTKQKLDSPEITGAPVDQGSFCSSQRVRPKQPWVQPNAADPLGNEARILARCHTAFDTTTTGEQELARTFVGDFQIVVDCLAGLFAQFKSDWPSCLLLSDRCAVRCVSTRSDILDLDRDDEHWV
jgi:hypothetical protein